MPAHQTWEGETMETAPEDMSHGDNRHVNGRPPAARNLVVLVADDEPSDLEFARRCLGDHYHLILANTFEEAEAVLKQQHIDLAIVDIYLDPSDLSPRGVLLLDDARFTYVPMVLVSGKPASRVGRTYTNEWEKRRFIFLDKNQWYDVASPKLLIDEIDAFAARSYNLDITFNFRGPVRSWDGLADKFCDADTSTEQKARLAHELQFLVRKAFHNWDLPISPVQASEIVVYQILQSGSNSVVTQMRPYAADGSAHADVILKIVRINGQALSDHSKFDEYKNIVGGYGLRERRYARTQYFHGQVYAVPYYDFDETQTYFDYFRNAGAGEEDLKTIEELTRYLFNNALGHFNQRHITGSRELSTYYAERVKLDRRADSIEELIRHSPPVGLQNCVDGNQLRIRVNGETRVLHNPLYPVVRDRAYQARDDMAETALRHGDMHTANVLVDAKRKCCWYIDYESFTGDHYLLADHVEFEAHILCTLNPIRDLDLLAQFTDAITDPHSLKKIEDISGRCEEHGDAEALRKAYAAIREVRRSADKINGTNSPKNYYHALMYEALRVAGKADHDSLIVHRPTEVRRWHALITAAQLFEKIENMP
jgi:hypothetical protein